MQILKTLKTNWRDLVVGVSLTIGIAFVADMIERMATTDDGKVWLVNVVTSLRGLAAFAGANLAAFFLMSIAWPTLNKYSNEHFSEGWNSLMQYQRFFVLTAVALGYLIAAALCFAP